MHCLVSSSRHRSLAAPCQDARRAAKDVGLTFAALPNEIQAALLAPLTGQDLARCSGASRCMAAAVQRISYVEKTCAQLPAPAVPRPHLKVLKLSAPYGQHALARVNALHKADKPFDAASLFEADLRGWQAR